MVRESRYQGYLNGMKEMKDKATQKKESTQNKRPAQGTGTYSSPKSILAKLKDLNGQDAVVSVPIGGTNE